MESEVSIVLKDINQIYLTVQSQLQLIRSEVRSKIDLEEANADLRQSFLRYESKLNELRILAEELEEKKKRDELNQDFISYKNQLTTLRTALRKANVQCHQRIDNETREALLSGSSRSLLERDSRNRISMQKQSRDITENLASVSRLLAEQVKKSERTLESLAGSSNTLEETKEELKTMTGVVGTSRKLLSKYDRRALTDKLLIFLAFTLFICTVFYIVKKRLFPNLF